MIASGGSLKAAAGAIALGLALAPAAGLAQSASDWRLPGATVRPAPGAQGPVDRDNPVVTTTIRPSPSPTPTPIPAPTASQPAPRASTAPTPVANRPVQTAPRPAASAAARQAQGAAAAPTVLPPAATAPAPSGTPTPEPVATPLPTDFAASQPPAPVGFNPFGPPGAGQALIGPRQVAADRPITGAPLLGQFLTDRVRAIPAGEKVRVAVFPRERTPFEQLSERMSGEGEDESSLTALVRLVEPLGPLLRQVEAERQGVLTAPPLTIR